MTPTEHAAMTMIAAAELSRRVFEMRDNWAESSKEKQQDLWRNVHSANSLYHQIKNYPGDFQITVAEKTP